MLTTSLSRSSRDHNHDGNSNSNSYRGKIDLSATSDSVKAMSLFNSYEMGRVRRSKEEIAMMKHRKAFGATNGWNEDENDNDNDGDNGEGDNPLSLCLIDQPSPRRDAENSFVYLPDTFYDSDLEDQNAYEVEEDDPSSKHIAPRSMGGALSDEQKNAYTEAIESKINYKSLHRSVAEHRTVLGSEDWDVNVPLNDPNSNIKTFLKSVLDAKRAPVNFILKQNSMKSLDMNGLGCGDDYGVAISECLPMLQHLQVLNLSSNRLTDVSLQPILRSAKKMNSLAKLNLSCNDMDELGARELRQLLSMSRSKLVELNLSNTDVDDEECVELAMALEYNRTLTYLNLSKNIIGGSERLNTILPELITGPGARPYAHHQQYPHASRRELEQDQ